MMGHKVTFYTPQFLATLKAHTRLSPGTALLIQNPVMAYLTTPEERSSWGTHS